MIVNGEIVSCKGYSFVSLENEPLFPIDKLKEFALVFFEQLPKNIFSDNNQLQDYCFEAFLKALQSNDYKRVSEAFRKIIGPEKSVLQRIIEKGSDRQVENFLKLIRGTGKRQKWLQKHLTCGDHVFALHFAAHKNRPKLIEKLFFIQERNGRNLQGLTPLHSAISSGATESLAILLKTKGVSLEKYCRVNHPKKGLEKLELFPASLAVAFGKTECFDQLVENSNKQEFDEIIPLVGNWLHLAIDCGELNMLKHLLTQYIGASKPLFNDSLSRRDGYTPLAFAASCGHLKAMYLLWFYGADLNWKDREERTALHHAVIQKQDEAVRLLLFLGAKPKLRDMYAKDAMCYAHGNVDVELLLANAIQGIDLIPLDFTSLPFSTMDINASVERLDFNPQLIEKKKEDLESDALANTIDNTTLPSFELQQLSPLPKNVQKPGLYVLGLCTNLQCDVVNLPIWTPRGFGTFSVKEDILYISTCGTCKTGYVEVSDIGIYDCDYEIDGHIVEPELGFIRKKKTGVRKQMEIFDQGAMKSMTWSYLKITVIEDKL